MKELYPSELTEKSFKELADFVNFMKIKGHIPLIVGGWAVYAYTKGLGSRDIDVVFQNAHARELALEGFFASHGYEEKKVAIFGITKQLVKKIQIGDHKEEISVDACTAGDIRSKNELGTIVKWAWAVKDDKKISVDGLEFYVPSQELLVVYKILAAIGRSNELLRIPEVRRIYLKSKIWKDYYDILSLVKKCSFSFPNVRKYLKESRVINHLDKFIDDLANYEDIMKEIGIGFGDVQDFIKKAKS